MIETTHYFDTEKRQLMSIASLAEKTQKLIVVNFSFDPKEDIKCHFAEKYDIEPSHTLLITLMSASKREEAVSKRLRRDDTLFDRRAWASDWIESSIKNS